MADVGSRDQGRHVTMAAPTAPGFDLDTRNFRDLERDLRRLQGGRASLTRYAEGVRDVAERQVIPALRNKVRSLPSKGQSAEQGKPELRDATARSIVYRFTVDGVHAASIIRANPTRMRPRSRFSGFLPSYMEGVPGFTNWRHPVWGNREVWRRQPATPFMQDVIARYTPEIMRVAGNDFEQQVGRTVQGRRGR